MRLPDSFYSSVRARLAEALDARGLDGFLATSPADVAFLSGFFYIATERPVYLWMPREGDPLLVIPRLDEEYAAQQGVGVETVSYFEFPGVVSAEQTLGTALASRGAKQIGVSAGLSIGAYRALSRALGGSTLVTTDAVAKLRLRKFPEEIPFHEAAARICDEMLAAGRELIADALRRGAELPARTRSPGTSSGTAPTGCTPTTTWWSTPPNWPAGWSTPARTRRCRTACRPGGGYGPATP
ncbi:aminopeptidase P family N-terminal domain-containing protein [Plantactinospora veratri]